MWEGKRTCGVDAQVYCNANSTAKFLANKIAKTVGSLDPTLPDDKKILRKVGRCITRAQNDILIPPDPREPSEYMRFQQANRGAVTMALLNDPRRPKGKNPTGAQIAIAIGNLWRARNKGREPKTLTHEQQLEARQRNSDRARYRKEQIKIQRAAMKASNVNNLKPYRYGFLGQRKRRHENDEGKMPDMMDVGGMNLPEMI